MENHPILLVQDEADDLVLLEHVLRNAGVTAPIQFARNGREALGYFKRGGGFSGAAEPPVPGLVLLDLKMPGTMGMEVLRWIRSQPDLSSTVVIPLTSSDRAEDIADAYRLGANGYLIRPQGLEELRAMAKAIKDFWLTENYSPGWATWDSFPEPVRNRPNTQ